MKQLIIAGMLSFFSIATIKAQSIQSIETQVLLHQFKAARLAIDKAILNDKLSGKAETWALRSAIYSSLAIDSSSESQVAELFDESVSSFNRYKQLDPSFTLMKDFAYNSGPINIYSTSFKKGVAAFNTKNWQMAYNNFALATETADFLKKASIIQISMDTTSILYAGAAAQNMKNDENAKKYFARLADAKVVGSDYEFLYQFLANYYMNKKDGVNFAKIVALGKLNYPSSSYFPAVEQDYRNSQASDYVYMRKGEDLFAKLYSTTNANLSGSDIAATETEMIAAFTSAARANTAYAGLAYTSIGNHYINKSVAVNDSINLPAAGNTPDMLKKKLARKELLLKEYDKYTEQAIANYEKAAYAFAKLTSLDDRGRKTYKQSVSYLIDLYAEKKTNAQKMKHVEDAATFEAAEKKWNNVYMSLK